MPPIWIWSDDTRARRFLVETWVPRATTPKSAAFFPGSATMTRPAMAPETAATKGVMDVARARGQRAVVYDSTGEFVAHYHREGKDVILSPIDQRSALWSPWSEGTDAFAYENLAQALIPDGTGDNQFRSSLSSVTSRPLAGAFIGLRWYQPQGKLQPRQVRVVGRRQRRQEILVQHPRWAGRRRGWHGQRLG